MWTAHITEEEEMSGTRWAARIGAIFYILWGVFHLMAAKAVFGLADLANGMTRARLQQDAFYLLAFAVAGMAIAVLLNWRNDRCGYWLNAVLLARSEEHTSELQSLMRISYAVFCLKKKKQN